MITKLINKDLISLNLKATTKDGVFIEMIDMLKKQGRISDSEAFLNDVKAREAIGNTGFEPGREHTLFINQPKNN